MRAYTSIFAVRIVSMFSRGVVPVKANPNRIGWLSAMANNLIVTRLALIRGDRLFRLVYV